jgi:hypothetical protein
MLTSTALPTTPAQALAENIAMASIAIMMVFFMIRSSLKVVLYI